MTSVEASNSLPGERIVAFIDVLGFSALVGRIFSTADEASFGRLLSTLQDIALRAESAEPGKIVKSDTRATAFSDSIVISDEVSLAGHMRVLSSASYLAASLMLEGKFCRGGIVLGALYHNERIVVGPGMIQAHDLESHVAFYPRILVSDSIAQYAEDLLFAKVVRDEDGLWYLDPFYHLQAAGEPRSHILDLFVIRHDPAKFETAREHIVQNLTLPSAIGISAKYRWLAIKFNAALGRYGLQDRVEEISLNFNK